MIHNLKIRQCYLMHLLEGRKNFEIRCNDRDYQSGDIIKFLPLEDENYDCYEFGQIPQYKIDYIMAECPGLEPGYAILAIKPLGGNDERC